MSALSADTLKLPELDVQRGKSFLIQCAESVDSRDTAQLAVFIQMVFGDFFTSTENYKQRSGYLQSLKDYFVGEKKPC